jgi:hypothetical protein
MTHCGLFEFGTTLDLPGPRPFYECSSSLAFPKSIGGIADTQSSPIRVQLIKENGDERLSELMGRLGLRLPGVKLDKKLWTDTL